MTFREQTNLFRNLLTPVVGTHGCGQYSSFLRGKA